MVHWDQEALVYCNLILINPGIHGFLLSNPEHFDSVANWISQKGFQMCTHAIGDSGNRTMLNIYAKYLKGKNDLALAH